MYSTGKKDTNPYLCKEAQFTWHINNWNVSFVCIFFFQACLKKKKWWKWKKKVLNALLSKKSLTLADSFRVPCYLIKKKKNLELNKRYIFVAWAKKWQLIQEADPRKQDSLNLWPPRELQKDFKLQFSYFKNDHIPSDLTCSRRQRPQQLGIYKL